MTSLQHYSIALVIFGSATAAFAQNAEQEAEQKGGLTIGLGAWGSSVPFEDVDDEANGGVVPWIAYENAWISVDPSGLALTVGGLGPVALQAVAAPRWVFADPSDYGPYSDMKRDVGLDVGGRALVGIGSFGVMAEYLIDVSHVSDGAQAVLAGQWETAFGGRYGLGLQLGGRWRDAASGQFDFGVYTDEAAPGRPAYKPDDSISPFVGVIGTAKVSGRTSVVTAIETEVLAETLTDSPIIEEKPLISGFTAIVFAF